MSFLANTSVWTPFFTAFLSERSKNYYKLSALSTRVLFSPYTPTQYPGGRRATAGMIFLPLCAGHPRLLFKLKKEKSRAHMSC